jgi:hypothetical protein
LPVLLPLKCLPDNRVTDVATFGSDSSDVACYQRRTRNSQETTACGIWDAGVGWQDETRPKHQRSGAVHEASPGSRALRQRASVWTAAASAPLSNSRNALASLWPPRFAEPRAGTLSRSLPIQTQTVFRWLSYAQFPHT